MTSRASRVGALSARHGAGIRGSRRRRRCRTIVLPREKEDEEQLILSQHRRHEEEDGQCNNNSYESSSAPWKTLLASSSLMVPLVTTACAAAASASDAISTGSLDPSRFVPVCPTSDGFYRILQGSTEAVVGREAFVEYGPLIAGGLLRIRLELCVVESFVNEAVIPFVKQNGLSWILPLHETVETFLAGVIFALAATFILIGSTKIITIIITYTDFLVGFPCRLLGGFSYDRALGKPVTLDVGLGPFKTRLVGPPQETMDENEADWGKLGPASLATVLVSGSVKSVGIVLGVRFSARVGWVDRWNDAYPLIVIRLTPILPLYVFAVRARATGRSRRLRWTVSGVLGVLLHSHQVRALQR
jgi:hypothetical protein